MGVLASLAFTAGILGVTLPERVRTPSGDIAYRCPPGTHPWGIYPFIGCIPD